jgi:anti-sigma factor RsiW
VVFTLIIVAGLVLTAETNLSLILRAGPDTPEWERDWQFLPEADRLRLAALTRTLTWRKELSDPVETKLACGFERREKRRRAPAHLALLAIVIVPAILAFGGIVGGGIVGTALGTFVLLDFAVDKLRDEQIKRRARAVTDTAPAVS